MLGTGSRLTFYSPTFEPAARAAVSVSVRAFKVGG
jgi:hypothetical protein